MQNPRKKEFEEFYNMHLDKVYRFVFFRVGANKALAEDLVSEIFMKVLENFASYNKEISKSAWVITIARNHLANHWRDAKYAGSLPEDESDSSDALWLDLAKKMSEKHKIKQEAYELLEKLDENTREIVTFHYLLGYSYAEIGEIKGMSETAVKVAAHRALKKLSSQM